MKHKRHHPFRAVALDLLFIGLGLILFALFDHAIPREYAQAADVPVAPIFATPSPTVSTPQEAESGVETVTPAPQPTSALTGWAVKWPDQFAQGGTQSGENFYKSANVSVEVTKYSSENLTYFVADIYVSDLQRIRAGLANDAYGKGVSENVASMAARENAIVAISGDYYAMRDKGLVVRNGRLFRSELWQDVCVIYADGVMETYDAATFDLTAANARGIWQGWSFGPKLLENGVARTKFHTSVYPANPRSAIGYYEPGHYCFVTVDGRQSGYSDGLDMGALAKLMESLGCQTAYNLDGGQTSMMYFGGEIISRPSGGGRPVSDILLISEVSEP